MAIIHFTI